MIVAFLFGVFCGIIGGSLVFAYWCIVAERRQNHL
jgi:hypothetical protein